MIHLSVLIVVVVFVLGVVAALEGWVHRIETISVGSGYSRARYRDFVREVNKRKWRFKSGDFSLDGSVDNVACDAEIFENTILFEDVYMLLPVWEYWRAALLVLKIKSEIRERRHIRGVFLLPDLKKEVTRREEVKRFAREDGGIDAGL